MWKRFLFPQSTWLDKRLLDHVEKADLAMDIDFMSGQMPRQESLTIKAAYVNRLKNDSVYVGIWAGASSSDAHKKFMNILMRPNVPFPKWMTWQAATSAMCWLVSRYWIPMAPCTR